MNLRDIAEALQGELVGDGSIEVSRAVHPADAESPTDLALAMGRDLIEQLDGSAARIAILADDADLPAGLLDGYVLVGRARYAMAGLMQLFEKPVHAPDGIHPSAAIEPDAEIGAGVRIGPFTHVGKSAVVGSGTVLMSHVTVGAEAELGPDCLVHAGVRVGERVRIGARAILHHNASLGADGFSFVTPTEGSAEQAKGNRKTDSVDARNTTIVRVNSIGAVEIGDDVEIGACTVIDRGTVRSTRIGNGTKIDGLVMIGHNVVIGENCMLCGLVGIGGSTHIGNRVVLAGQVGVADHVTIGDDVVVGAGSGVANNLKSGIVAFGYPAVAKSEAIEIFMNTRRLKRVFGEHKEHGNRLNEIESRLDKG